MAIAGPVRALPALGLHLRHPGAALLVLRRVAGPAVGHLRGVRAVCGGLDAQPMGALDSTPAAGVRRGAQAAREGEVSAGHA